MHDIKWIRDNREAFDAGCRSRGLSPISVEVCALEEKLRPLGYQIQKLRERRKELSDHISQVRKEGKIETAESLRGEVLGIREELTQLEEIHRKFQEELTKILEQIPNFPFPEVPYGVKEEENIEQRRWEAPRRVSAPANFLEHFELGEKLGGMDFETAALMSGARFVVTKGPLAQLERALSNFMVDMHTQQHGYTEVNPPLLVRESAMYGTGQLPKFRQEQFSTSGDFWLIPTAEVSLTNLVREKILNEEVLPLRFVASTPCFRSEAGAAGKDTRGLIRQHQFYKVELVSITSAEQARAEHERMTACAENILKALGLSYRLVLLCSQEMGFSSHKTYDLEVWLAGQKKFREISSCSLCGTFQARRMGSRYRTNQERQVQFVHTLNGSGVAIGRALVAVLENYQNTDGSVDVPSCLVPYMNGLQQLRPISLM